jgi:steroid delta-isomerase-like uncharacterized protein
MAETSVNAELDAGFATEFAERWAAAWNSHDIDRLLELTTEDIVYDDSAWPRTMRGHADAREFLEFVWRATPDLDFEILGGPFLAPGEPKAVIHWKATGTFSGPLDPPGFAPTGAHAEFEGFDLHEYRDGRVARLRVVFDMMDISRQIGLMPKHGSGVEKAGASIQRLAMQVRSRLRQPAS